MNLQVLEYLIALEKHQSFSKASVACNISQPALSMQLKNLEQQLKITIVERLSKHLRFTSAGQEILIHARNVINEVGKIKTLSEDFSDPYHGQISLGAFPTLAPFLFPKIAQHLVDCYPNLKISLIEEKSVKLIDKLESGELDAAFLALPEPNDRFRFVKLFTEEFFVAVSEKHELTKLKKISAKQLLVYEMLLLEEGNCLRGQALTFCKSHNVQERLDFRASSLQTLLQMVAMGNAITLVPKSATNFNGVKFIPFSGDTPARTIGIFWRKNSLHNVIFEEIADDIVREYRI